MFSFFKKEKWAQVKTLTIDNIKWGTESGGKIFIHLFESDKGNRKMTSACSFHEAPQEKIDVYIKSGEFYQTKILRWLNGRRDPEISTYSEIGEEDTANALRGKVE